MATTGHSPQIRDIARHLPAGGLIVLAWVGVALVMMFVGGRTPIRITRVGGLEVDDWWIYFAYLDLVVNAVLWKLQTKYHYCLMKVGSGLEPLDQVFDFQGKEYVQYEFTVVAYFWSAL